MTDQLTQEQRKALYNERKGKKQRLPTRVLVQSTATFMQKGKGMFAGKLLRTRKTVTAERGEKGQYAVVENTPKLAITDDKNFKKPETG